MTHRTLTHSLTASAAIAAALALSSTPALAQDAAPAMDAAPVIDAAPAADPVPATQPTTVTAPPPQIVLPPELATPVTEQVAAPAPVAATTTTTKRPAPRATTTNRTTPTTAQREAPARAAEAPAVSPIAANVASPSAEPLVVPPAPVAAEPAAPVAEAPEAAPADDGSNALALAAILAGLVGIGTAGTLAVRRRYRASATAYEPAYEPVSARPAAVPQPAIVAAPQPVARPVEQRELARADTADQGWVVAQDDIAMPATSRAAPGDLPDGPVPTGEARQRLLDRMVAAAPDAANPFTSNAARRKRARIILAAREHRQREDATRPFDFRSYRQLNEDEALPEPALA